MALILIVEDDEHQREIYADGLMGEGHDTLLARDGQEAIEIVEEQRPDLVVLDISMPGMDGIETMNRMLSKDNRLPIVLNTAYGNFREDFRTWPADAYVVKSSDLAELKDTIRKVLAERPPR